MAIVSVVLAVVIPFTATTPRPARAPDLTYVAPIANLGPWLEEQRLAEEARIAEAARVEAERIAAEEAARIAEQKRLETERAVAPRATASGVQGTASGVLSSPAPPLVQYSGGTNAHLYRIKMCESGGNYSAVSSNGMYFGAYQFSLSTWRAMGGSGLPSAASPAEQDMRAQRLYDSSNPYAQWPVCAYR